MAHLGRTDEAAEAARERDGDEGVSDAVRDKLVGIITRWEWSLKTEIRTLRAPLDINVRGTVWAQTLASRGVGRRRRLGASQYGWWLWCQAQGSGGKRGPGPEPALAVELLMSPS